MSRKNEAAAPSLYDLLEASMELDQKILQYLRHSDDRRNQVLALMMNKKPTTPTSPVPPVPRTKTQTTEPTEEFVRQKFSDSSAESSRPQVARSRSLARPLRGNLNVVPDLMNLPELPKIRSYSKLKRTVRQSYVQVKRDIKQLEDTFEDPIPARNKILIVVASLLSQKLDRTVDIEEKLVIDLVDKIMEMAITVESEMINAYFRKKQISRLKALKTPWDIIYKSIRATYCSNLEKRVWATFDISLHRCENMWAAEELLKNVVETRLSIDGLQSISSLQEYENMMGIEQDIKPHTSDHTPTNTSDKAPAPPPVVIPANNDDSSGCSSNEDADEGEENTRKRNLDSSHVESIVASPVKKHAHAPATSSTVYFNE